MRISEKLQALGCKVPKELQDEEFDPHTGRGVFTLYKTSACNFEVLDRGRWYKIDTRHLSSGYYENTDVTEGVLERARSVVWPIYESDEWNDLVDPIPLYTKALLDEFDDARFVNMTIVPGAIY